MPSVMTVDDYVWPRREARGPVPPRRAGAATRGARSRRAGSRWRCSPARRRASPPVDGPVDGVFATTSTRCSRGSATSTRATSPSRVRRVPARPTAVRTSSTTVTSGKRVGITAMSHAAIDNLLGGDPRGLRGERRPRAPDGSSPRRRSPRTAASTGVRTRSRNADAESERLQPGRRDDLAVGSTRDARLPGRRAGHRRGGTAGARRRRRRRTNAAHNLILLGDPLQLSQVSQAEHPDGSGASVLEHVLGEHATIPDDRGRVHLRDASHASRRVPVHLRPDLRGTPDEPRVVRDQSTEFGTGLRWIEAHHTERSTESREEAELVDGTDRDDARHAAGSTRTA